MNTKTQDCDLCNKASLSLLLLRPSPVAHLQDLAPPGANAVATDSSLTSALLPQRQPTESRPVLRLLREGFIHIYIASPPKPVPNWLVYQVNANGDIRLRNAHPYDPMLPPEVCARKTHNALGSRLLTLPRPDKIDRLWIAFSANVWNDTLKARNAGNPNVMREVFPGRVGPHTFKPTAANLQSKVLEFSVGRGWRGKQVDHDFDFVSLVGSAQAMADVMKNAAAGHPQTIDMELAIVLDDPVGYASELNALRLRRQAMAVDEMAQEENAHPLNSSHLLMGLKQVVIDTDKARSWETISPVMSRGAFDSLMRVKPNPRGWPEGTEWQPLEGSRENVARHGYGQGRVVFPDHAQRAAAWAREQSAATWALHEKHYDEAARLAWLQSFEQRMDAKHFQPLGRFEEDWWAAASQARLHEHFGHHFDENDPNDPLKPFSSGEAYAKEVMLALTPEPLTTGTTLQAYVAQADKPIADPAALSQRALVGNQAALFASVQAVMDVQPSAAADHLHNERNDKLYDLGVGWLNNAHDAKNPTGLQLFAVKYRWLLSEFFGGYTLLIKKSLLGAAMHYVPRVVTAAVQSGAPSAQKGFWNRLLVKVESLALVQRTSELTRQAVVSNGLFRTPVQVTMMVPLHEAMVLLGARGSHSRLQVSQASRGGKVAVTALSDSVELRRFAGNVGALVESGAGRVHLPTTQGVIRVPLPASGTMTLTLEQFTRLWKHSTPAAGLAAQAMKEAFSARMAVTRSIEGRLALGAILINSVGLFKSIGDLNHEDRTKVRDAWIGTLDSSASVIAGSMQVLEVAAKESITRRVGAHAVGKAEFIFNVRTWAAGLGAFAAAVSAVGQLLRAYDAGRDGRTEKASMYVGSGFAFVGLGVVGLLTTIGIIADKQVAKGIATAFMRRMAIRYGAQGTATLLGVSMSGWGLILLGGALIFEAGVVLVTPTALQEWMRRSYFGNGKYDGPASKRKFERGDWEGELQALQEMFEGSKAEESPSDEAPPIDYIGIAP